MFVYKFYSPCDVEWNPTTVSNVKIKHRRVRWSDRVRKWKGERRKNCPPGVFVRRKFQLLSRQARRNIKIVLFTVDGGRSLKKGKIYRSILFVTVPIISNSIVSKAITTQKFLSKSCRNWLCLRPTLSIETGRKITARRQIVWTVLSKTSQVHRHKFLISFR